MDTRKIKKNDTQISQKKSQQNQTDAKDKPQLVLK